MATESSSTKHTDVCSYFELGQCLLFFLFIHHACLCPHPFYRESARHAHSDGGDLALDHSLQSTVAAALGPVHLFSLEDKLCFHPSAIKMPPLYSIMITWKLCGSVVDWCLSLDLVLWAPMSSITVTCTVWTTSLQNFLPAEKQQALGIFQSHADEYVSFICKLCETPSPLQCNVSPSHKCFGFLLTKSIILG